MGGFRRHAGAVVRTAFRRYAGTAQPAFQLVECPRDAMQGLPNFVPTAEKIRYCNQLLKVGYHTLDFGSFVSAPAVPQMRDTAEVLAGLDLDNTNTELLVVVCNVKGAEIAAKHPQIKYLGFPLSISETFQQRNTRKSIPEAFETLEKIQEICAKSGKELVTYLSMAFGNPYGDNFDAGVVSGYVDQVVKIGGKIVSLADTVGCSTKPLLDSILPPVLGAYKDSDVIIGCHFHSPPATAREKVEAALQYGCKRIDSAIGGMGGCPFAKSSLVGNVPTELVIAEANRMGMNLGVDTDAFLQSQAMKHELFGVAVSQLLLQCYIGDEKGFEILCKERFDLTKLPSSEGLDRGEFEGTVREVLQELGEPEPNSEKLRRLFAEADQNKDGVVTFDEFHRIAREKVLLRAAQAAEA